MGKISSILCSLFLIGCAVTKLHFLKPRRIYTLIVFANGVDEAEAWAVIDEGKKRLLKESNILLDLEYASLSKEVKESSAQKFLMDLKVQAYNDELLNYTEYDSIIFVLPGSSLRLIKGYTESVGCAFSMRPCASFVRLRTFSDWSVAVFVHEVMHQVGSKHTLPFLGTGVVY